MITLRTVPVEQWHIGRDIRLAALAGSPPGTFGSTFDEAATWPDRQWRQWVSDRVLVVAERAGGVVGSAALVHNAEDGPLLVSMWVDPSARGTGASDRLVDAVVGAARAAGHDELRLWVLEGNRGAEALYERMGFRRTGRSRPCSVADSRIETEMLRALLPDA
ncbi:GNAT family N-acetyltransferase [Nocardia lijiangensis]|uniref:GNAT family N-acetyltransferase n=1 Tax=Nocardia lijiangensis TaxID=299618 RepID=UPI000835936E|nr:GNAT family N-acetyltransferase [Nocardia lijiangensis]